MVFFYPSVIFSSVVLTAICYWAYGAKLVDPFEFNTLTIEQIRYGVIVFASFFIASSIGCKFGESIPNLRKPIIKRYPFLESFLGLLLFIISSLIYLEFTFTFFSSLLEGRGFRISDRSYIDRLSMLKIGVLIWCAFFIRKYYENTYVPIFFLGFFSLCLVFLDVSREAVLPAVALFFIAKGKGCKGLVILLILFVLIYSMLGRDYRLSSISFSLAAIYFIEAVNYILGMCFLHFVQVVTAIEGNDFSLSHFLTSIIPVPGALVDSGSLDSRNFDMFRPYGAAADLYLWNPVVMYLLLFQWGFVLGCANTVKRRFVKYGVLIFLCLIYVWIFQYHLRTSYKFLAWLTVLVIFLDRDLIKSDRIKKRLSLERSSH